MNLRTITAAILASVFCTGLALAATPMHDEWSDITPVQGLWSMIYFDYQQVNPGDTGRFYCFNDWVVNMNDTCKHGGLVCDTTPDSACEANMFTFTIGVTNYTIKIYKETATIYPLTPGFEGHFSWNPSINSPIDHTVWEFSFPIHPTIMYVFTGHDPAVISDSIFNPPPPAIITTGPSQKTHYNDGLFADYDTPLIPVCSPTQRSFIPDNSLPKDPRIPPLEITLKEGGGVIIRPQTHDVPIPTLTEWGLIIFAVLLVGLMTWVVIRRRRRVTVGI